MFGANLFGELSLEQIEAYISGKHVDVSTVASVPVGRPPNAPRPPAPRIVESRRRAPRVTGEGDVPYYRAFQQKESNDIYNNTVSLGDGGGMKAPRRLGARPDAQSLHTLDQLETRSGTVTMAASERASTIGDPDRSRPVRRDAAAEAMVAGPTPTMPVVGGLRDHLYNPDLAITKHREELLLTIKGNSVSVIQGPTGCGKTTQIPQYVLDDCSVDRVPCNIVVTQPRRIAAMSIAKRVCHERGWGVGGLCGYQVSLKKAVSPDTHLTYVTTGVLLQKLIGTKDMSEYTHIFIDEVHERDKDTDFLLLLVRKLLFTTSRNVKVILMSATFDCQAFSQYFTTRIGENMEPAPMIGITSTSYEVVEHYLDDLGLSQNVNTHMDNIVDAAVTRSAIEATIELLKRFDELEGPGPGGVFKTADGYINFPKLRGSLLIFLPGMASIKYLQNRLSTDIGRSSRLLLLPLHSQMTSEDQSKVFEPPHPCMRKVILSTNIAESSITVPDVKYVIDFCLTKYLAKDPETNYPTLRISWASQANCTQRKGRAGRVSDGQVYRLVTRPFYHSLDLFSEPEITRCPLEQLVLQTKLMNIGAPINILSLALDPPDLDSIEQAILNLKEVGALVAHSMNPHDGTLTFMGEVLAALPLDVRFAKMLVFGHIFGVLRDCVIIAASLSSRTFLTQPLRDEVAAFKSTLSWSDGSMSDSLTSLYAYKRWEELKEQNYFLKQRNSESVWCAKHYIQRARIEEVKDMVRELLSRLEKFNITPVAVTSQEHRERVPAQDKIILQVVLACAFYPNYFVSSSVSETDAVKLFGERDRGSTVYLANLPMGQGPFYKSDIEEMLRVCGQDARLSFEDTKCYAEFLRSPSDARKVLPAVIMALKMKDLRIPLVLTLYNEQDIQTQLLKIQKERDELATSEGKLVRRAEFPAEKKASVTLVGGVVAVVDLMPTQSVTVPVMKLPKGSVKFALQVVHWADFGHFYVQPFENCDTVAAIMEELSEYFPKAPKIPYGLVKMGIWCMAPYIEQGQTSYYRARVGDIIDHSNIQVYFLDYGDSAVVPRDTLRTLPSNLMVIPPQALECQLAHIKPPLDGMRVQESIRAFKRLTQQRRLVATIYSRVQHVYRLVLFDDKNKSLNEYLVDRDYGIMADESFVSEQSHALLQDEGLDTSGTVTLSHTFDDTEIRKKLRRAPGRKHQLRGPWSPYEVQNTFDSLTYSGSMSAIRVRGGSVNSVILDVEPEAKCLLLLIAGGLSVNEDSRKILLSDTTVMPKIRGIASLIPLLFAPRAELRVDPEGKRYVGALCGLGFDDETKLPIYSEHDMEISFDAEITQEDIISINRVRTVINMAVTLIRAADEQTVMRIQKKAREDLITVLEKSREPSQSAPRAGTYAWNQIPTERLMDKTGIGAAVGPGHSAAGHAATGDSLSDDILRPHAAVLLVEEDQEANEKAARAEGNHRAYLQNHKAWLWTVVANYEKAGDRSYARQIIVCDLCGESIQGAYELRAHLNSERHRFAEMRLD